MTKRLNFTLTELGLPELLPLFETQGIDDAVLGNLSDGDLREIGIDKLGDRKKLLKAFGGDTSFLGEAPSIEIVSEAPKATPQDQFTYAAQSGEIIITGFHGKGHVVVPDRFDDLPLPVRVIGREAFKDNGMLLSVVLPKGVTKIETLAFVGCSSLTRMAIPCTVIEIQPLAFAGCSSLERDCLMPFINIGVFNGSGITSITIPESVTSIGERAFQDCLGLTSVVIPEGVTSIGACAFQNCRSLTSITIPKSVTSIRTSAFFECSSLTSITIPEGVTSIGEWVFAHCMRLTSITIPEGVISIRDYAFWNCRSLTSITIPKSVTSIGECAFGDCSSLTSITIPEGVTSIGERAFKGCPIIPIFLSHNHYHPLIKAVLKGLFPRLFS